MHTHTHTQKYGNFSLLLSIDGSVSFGWNCPAQEGNGGKDMSGQWVLQQPKINRENIRQKS